MKFVLDASVALSWLLEDAGPGQAYAVAVFDVLGASGAEAYVPTTWGLEVANVIAKCEARGELPVARSHAFLKTLAATPIRCDAETFVQTFGQTLECARRYRLSAYDASYLELALRSSLPLATLDEDLRRAASRASVKVFKPK
jgi:predicted nucleic acid-binding protein